LKNTDSTLEVETFDSSLHNFYLIGEIDEERYVDFLKQWNNMISSDESIISNNSSVFEECGFFVDPATALKVAYPPINIYLNTYGGNIYDGLAYYDLIKSTQPYLKNVYCSGKVMSMGIPILLAGTKKYAYENTTFLIHQASSFSEGKVGDMEDDVKEAKRLNNILFNIISKNTDIKIEDLRDIYKTKKDFIIDAKEALKLKLIDEIIK
jgi:ATP-dependent Clp endopeptidase proteolytic subunit ClpP